MLTIVIAMALILLLCGVVVAYVAFPHRGADLPGAPWLGRLMRRGARSLPTVVPADEAEGGADGDVVDDESVDGAPTDRASTWVGETRH